MKKYIILSVLAFLFCTNTVFAYETSTCPQAADIFEPETGCINNSQISAYKNQNKCRELIQRMFDDRAAVYNVLNLSSEQKKCKDDIEKRRYDELDTKIILYEKLCTAPNEECNCQTDKAELRKQKKTLKNIEQDIDNIMYKYDKEFKCILTRAQKTKYKNIQKIKKEELKQCKKGKRLFKQDPNLLPFGCYK